MDLLEEQCRYSIYFLLVFFDPDGINRSLKVELVFGAAKQQDINF